jgi:hypothetical protein
LFGLAPRFLDLLLEPRERVLWPVLIVVGAFAVVGYWIGRRERRPSKHEPAAPAVRAPDTTGHDPRHAEDPR